MRKIATIALAVASAGALAVSLPTAYAQVTAKAAAAPALATGDARNVSEPSLPPVCASLTAQRNANNRQFSAADEQNPPDTARIQAALNSCAASNSSRVAVELKVGGSNKAYLTGPLELGANTVLLINTGVTVYASRNPANYQVPGGPACGTIATVPDTFTFGCKALIHSSQVRSGVMGTRASNGVQGLIDGRGDLKMIGKSQTWWELAKAAKGKPVGTKQMNPRMIQTDGANDFIAYHLSMLNPPKFHMYFQGGVGITAWGVKLLSPEDAPNTDGIDPASATNVTIAESWISTGDDGVAIKGNAGPAKNITIKNNHFYNTHGISIGSETLGVSNVLVANNTIEGADNGLRIKSNASLGGLVTDVTYLNTCLKGVKKLLLFDTHYTSNGSLNGSNIPLFTNIVINGLKAVNSQSSAASTFDGYDAAHPLGLTMQNVSLDKTKIKKASYANIGLYNTNIKPTGTGVTTSTVTGSSAVPSCSFPNFPGL